MDKIKYLDYVKKREMSQLSFADIELGLICKPSRISLRLVKINTIVDWDKIYD